MADDEYEAKFQEMQKHIPFIQKVIEKLKVSNDSQGDNPRQGQLEKMETLHELLTNRVKKLKMDTLIKFEGVLIKLQAKIEKHSNLLQNEEPPQKSLDSTISNPPIVTTTKTPAASTSEATKRLRAITSAPSSPSPERIVDIVEPVVIPTERRDSPFELIDKEKRTSAKEDKAKDSKHRRPEHQMQRAVHLSHQQPHHHLNNAPKLEEISRLPKISRNDTTQHNERNDKHATPPNVSRFGINSCNTKSSANFLPLPPTTQRSAAKDTHRDSSFKNHQTSQKKDSSSSTTTTPAKSSGSILVQSVQVIITEPLPASLVQQHFPPQHQSRYQLPMQQHSPVGFQRFSNNVEIIPLPMTPSLAANSNSSNDKAYSPAESWQKYNETKNITPLSTNKNSVFSRLGDKVVQKDPPLALTVLTPKPSTPVAIPTTRTHTPIPEVLKSPPLSYTDINNLLKESGGDQPIPDISEVGTRRPKKTEPDESKSSLEFVRRKFAQIAKINSSPTTVIPSPPPLNELKIEEKATSSTCAENVSPVQQRLALKYNPHPRKERLQSLSSNDGSECSQQSFSRVGANPNDPRLKLKSLLSPGVNVLPTLNTNDPRLKKVMNHDTLAMPSSAASLPPTNVFGVRSDPRIARQQPSLSTTQITQQVPIRRMSISQPFKAADENWDTDSSTSSMVGRSPVRIPPISQPYVSSEENWDSDPEISSMNNTNSLSKTPSVISTYPANIVCLYGARKDPRIIRNPQAQKLQPEENWDLDSTGNKKIDCNFQRQMSVGADRSSLTQSTVRRHSQPREIPPAIARENSRNESPKDKQPKENPMSRNLTPHSASFNPFSHSAPTDCHRFNYAVNDSTERKKYFESKHQKSFGPRTYKEHKEARVENNRRVMVPERKLEKKQDHVNVNVAKKKFPEEKLGKDKEHKNVKNKIEQHHNKVEDKAKDKDKDKELEKDKELAMQSAKAVAAVTTLDKMYRSQNFNAQFPKTTLSFKIPKKKTEETKPPQPAIEPNAPKENQKKSLQNVVKSFNKPQEKIDKNGSNKKPPGQKPKQVMKSNEDKLEKPMVVDSPKPEKQKAPKLHESEDNKEATAFQKTLNVRDPRNIKKDTLGISVESKISDDASKKKNTKKEKTDVEETKTESSSANEEDASKQKTEKNYIEKIKDFVDATKKTSTVNVNNLTAFSGVSAELKPQRILRRRCTMVTIGSEPLVDKDKLMKANALMLEDIEARDKLKRKIDEEERQTARRNKNLSEMFQKTDDNCTVSTQNIISGKRSTRATINFNETQNALKIFKHKTVREASASAATSPSPVNSSTITTKVVKKFKAARAVVDGVSNSAETLSEKKDQKSERGQNATEPENIMGDLNKKDDEEGRKEDDKQKESLRKISMKTEGGVGRLEAKKAVDKQQDQNSSSNSSKTEIDESKKKTQFETNLKNLCRVRVKLAAVITGNKEDKHNSQKCLNATNTKPAMLADKPPPSSTADGKVNEPDLNKPAATKSVEDEHQNCAVSSTSAELTATEENTPTTSFAADQHFKAEAADNEPSSTGSKSSNATPTPTEDDSSRHEFLNKFVQEIVKPHADKQHILSLLSQILSEDKLQFIKSVIGSSTQDDKVEEDETEDGSVADINKELYEKTDETQTKDKAIAKTAENEHESVDEEVARNHADGGNSEDNCLPKLKKVGNSGRRTELDRLNDDIRDMFICEGVLTATGKRMCTLMQNTNSKKEGGDSESSPATSPSQIKKNVDYNSSSGTKRGVGRPRKLLVKPVRRSLRASKPNDMPINDDDDEAELSKFNDFENAQDNDETLIPKKMPVLKPHTPIKLPEELETIVNHDTNAHKRKVTNIKPCPKSKKLKTYNATETSEDFDETTTDDSQSESVITNSVEEESTNRNLLETIKNSNIHSHNQSKFTSWCVLCNKKILAKNSSFHYKLHHGENYISRLAPTILHKFNKGKLSRPLFGVDKAAGRSLWFYKCPFCLQYFNTPMQLWLEHFQNHTAEFRYECSKCHWGCNRAATTRRHISDKCKGAKIHHSTVKIVKPSEIAAHVCHLCNFIQLKRENLDRHYMEQHDVDEKNVDILGYNLILFNTENVEMVAEDRAQTKEDEVKKLIEDQQKIIVLRDEDVWHHKKQNVNVDAEKKNKENNEETKEGGDGGGIVAKPQNAEDESEFEMSLNKEIEAALIKSQEHCAVVAEHNEMPNVESKEQQTQRTRKLLSKTQKESKTKEKPIKLKIILPARQPTQLTNESLESGANKEEEKPKEDLALKESEAVEKLCKTINNQHSDKPSIVEAKTFASKTKPSVNAPSQPEDGPKIISESEATTSVQQNKAVLIAPSENKVATDKEGKQLAEKSLREDPVKRTYEKKILPEVKDVSRPESEKLEEAAADTQKEALGDFYNKNALESQQKAHGNAQWQEERDPLSLDDEADITSEQTDQPLLIVEAIKQLSNKNVDQTHKIPLKTHQTAQDSGKESQMVAKEIQQTEKTIAPKEHHTGNDSLLLQHLVNTTLLPTKHIDVVSSDGQAKQRLEDTITSHKPSTKESQQLLNSSLQLTNNVTETRKNLPCDQNTNKSAKSCGVSKEKPQNISMATTASTSKESTQLQKSSPPHNLLCVQKSSEPEKGNGASKENLQSVALNKVLPKVNNIKIKIMSPKFNAKLVSATYAKKKVTPTNHQSETSVATQSTVKRNESKDDCTIVSENMSCRILQDELLTLAAKVAEEEELQKKATSLPDIFDISNKNVSESAETLQLLLESENITSEPLESTYSSDALRTSTENENLAKDANAPQSTESITNDGGNGNVSSSTKMSDLISNSIDMFYQNNKRKSDDMELLGCTKKPRLPEQNTNTSTSNAFIASTAAPRGTSTSPIQILAQSIITIDSVNSNESGDVNDKPQSISIAERLSQRFKLLQEKANKTSQDSSSLEKPENIDGGSKDSSTLKELKESAVATIASKITPINSNEVTVISDDEDWEDIEITESAPNPVPANNLQKTKNKGLFQKFGLFKANTNNRTKKNVTPLAFMPKTTKKTKDKPPVGSASSPPITTKPFASDKLNNATAADVSLLSGHLGFKSVINNIEDLLPDSPCNDPIDMVPELTPLEPLTDLNDISSILDSNLSINMEESQTCIQDALDFISEQQANENQAVVSLTSAAKEHAQTKFHKNKIQHVGYSLQSHTTNSIKFYCLLEKCSFLFSSDAIGLENHFLCEHIQTKWNGYCRMCQSQCLDKDQQEYSIVSEIKHMLDCHVNGPSPPAAAESNSNDSSQHSTTVSQTAEERPRIKLRRLTGDCLSTSNSESPTPPSVTTGAGALLTPSAVAAGPPPPANLLLGALLNAKQKPPTKEMPPQPELPLTEPLLMDASNTTSRYTNLINDIQITSVCSASDNVVQVPHSNAPLHSASVVVDSLNNNNMETPIDSNDVIPNTTASLSSQKVGSLWYQQVVQEKQDLLDSRSAALEMSTIFANARKPPPIQSDGTRSLNDSPGPVLVSETVPMAQEKRGDFVITQTISTQYDDYASAAVGINISIEVPTPPLLNSSSMPPVEVLTPASALTIENNSTLIEMPAQLMGTANDEDDSRGGLHDTLNSPADMMTSSCTTPSITSRQYKCMAQGCKFTSRVPVAMSDHLRFHERRNFSNNRDYFDCAFCTYKAIDVDDYINHSDQYHIISKGSKYDTLPSSSSSSAAVRGNICDILSKKMETNAQRNLTALREAQKAALIKQKESDLEYLKKLQMTIEEIVGSTGLSDDKLYRCVIKNCPTKLNENTFHNHILYHISTLGISNPNTYIFKCPHCSAQYHRATGIKAHIKSHARNRYFCYMCDVTSANPSQMMKHFSEKHWHTLNMFTSELLKAKITLSADGSEKFFDSGYYVTYSSELSEAEVRKYGEKLILEWQRKKSGSKTHFKSSEIDLLPIQPIFQREVNCGECKYKTKVRTNMYRHLSMHKLYALQPHATQQSLVASVDPVNPVPCLNSNERFFDKMTNLASSSLVPSIAGAGAAATKAAYRVAYDFITDEKRFKCGVANCNCISKSENDFRWHLSMTHSNNVQAYRCPFCQEEICKRGISTERVINHLKLHNTTLYRCEECNYVHTLKYVVERHINDKHATMKLNIVRHERTDELGVGTMTMTSFSGRKYKEPSEAGQQQQHQQDSATTSATATTRSLTKSDTAAKPSYSSSAAALTAKSKSKWKCNLCKHTATSLNFIQMHCLNTHGQNKQYQCMHCTFGSQQLSQILYHIDEKHPGKAREARYIYHKVINSNEMDVADTRPLWQRNDPTRGRHIRGIQMEDEEESAKYRNIDDEDDDDDGLEEDCDKNNQTNSESSIENFLKGYEFSCFHCDYKTRDFKELSGVHHKTRHSSDEETSKPFMFRLLRRVCCPECRKFVGNFHELQLHLHNIHNVRYYYAADISVADAAADDASQKLVCGYCPFSCTRADQLSKHYQNPKVHHSPQDVHIENELQLSEIIKMGDAKQSYFRCTLCTELLPNRVSIVHHFTNQHDNEEGFSFMDLSNALVYHCALCSYSATTESVLLRHMIDHYGRFKHCHFCHEPQVSFEVYMQHCYAEHRDNIRKFKELYQYKEIREFLFQMLLVVFPNGLVMSKRNLSTAPAYGCEKALQELYEEIYKISQQPPIPRLSIARLVARKSIEAYQRQGSSGSPQDSETNIDLANALPNQAPLIAKKVAKRKSDVMMDEGSGRSISPTAVVSDNKSLGSNKKMKSSATLEDDTSSNQSSEFNVPLAHAVRAKKRRRRVVQSDDTTHSSCTDYTSTEEDFQSDAKYYSYYGIKPEPFDLSKVYTKIAIGGINTPLSIAKFRKLVNIDCQLNLTKCDVSNLPTYTQYKHVRKACPASHKLNYN